MFYPQNNMFIRSILFLSMKMEKKLHCHRVAPDQLSSLKRHAHPYNLNEFVQVCRLSQVTNEKGKKRNEGAT